MVVCKICNDTHLMYLEDHGNVMCTHCPSPCEKCRYKGKGAYCANIPCLCECHSTMTRHVKSKLEKMTEALRMIRDNYDHDEDAHKYGTICRVCLAEEILDEKN